MFRYSMRLISKRPGYIVKAQIRFAIESDYGNTDDEPQFGGNRGFLLNNEDEALSELRAKLQHVIPGSLHPRYILSSEGLVLSIEVDSVAKANGHLDKLHEYIQSAAVALNQKAISR